MADLPKISRQRQIGVSVPVLNISNSNPADPNSGYGAYSLGHTIRGMASRVEDRLDIIAETQAKKDGVIAGQSSELPALKDDTTITGRAFNMAARETALTRLQLEGRLTLSEYEDQNTLDPNGFQTKSESYLKGILPKIQQFDPAEAQNFEADFRLRADGILQQIKARHKDVVRDQQTETAIKMQIAANDEMGSLASSLFDGDPVEVEKKLGAMTSNAAKIVDVVHQIGPDGRPLFSARERVAAEQAAEESVSSSIGKAWLDRQPDKLAAYDAWQNGNAEMEIGVKNDDGSVTMTKINLKDLLGESGYQKAEDSFFDNLREDLDMQERVGRIRDRDFKQRSDDQSTYFKELAMKGILTERMVDDARPVLEGDTFIQLKTLARGGGASVSDGNVIAKLAADDASGIDIRPQLNEQYKAGKISTPDYIQYTQRNSTTLEGGMKTPVETGRSYVSGSLGGLAKELGFAQSASIAQANAEYEVKVDQFKKIEGREPTQTEALDIGKEVVRRYAVTDTSQTLQALPLPKMLTAADKFDPNLSGQKIERAFKDTNKFFLKKHSGNKSAMESDPEYLEEIRNLQDFMDIIKLRDANAARNTQPKQ